MAGAFAVSSCASQVHYLPQPTAGVTLAGDRATARNELVNVTVDHTHIDSYAYGGDDKFIIFRVGIRNLSPKPITFAPEQFLLIDDSGKQYSALPPQLVAAAGGPYQCSPRGGVGMGWGWSGPWGYPYRDPYRDPHWDPRWDPRWGWSPYWGGGGMGYYGNSYDCTSRFSEEIISKSLLPASPLQPNARMTGLVYFRGNAEETGPLRMEIHFPAAATLTFPFRPDTGKD